MLTLNLHRTIGEAALASGIQTGRSWSIVGSGSLFSSDCVMGLERGHKYIQTPATTTNPGGPFR
jgi:hypothetical protein